MMCVNWGVGQSVSVQTYLYVGAGRNLFTEVFPEGPLESGSGPLGKQLTVLANGGMEFQKGKQSTGSR